MPEKKQKLPIVIVWWETIFTIILSWIVKKFLDFIWTQGKTKIRIPRPRFASKSLRKLGMILMEVSFKLVIDTETSSLSPSTNSTILRQFEVPYMVHDALHELGVLKTGKCRYCESIMEDRDFLKRFTPDIEQHLPFKNITY